MPPRAAGPPPPAPDPARLAARRDAVLRWYDEHARELPWRTRPGPYRTWLSEVMLQQTRVEAVREKYAEFLRRFPTLAALAAAPLDDVLAAWSGLGYYRRARYLHAGARYVVGELGGRLPRTRRALEAVPGIGRYTAGAILSIAFGVEAALIDGNVERVFARAYRLPGDPKKGPLKKALWALADSLVTGERPGDWNQALMELGATVCAPRDPACGRCPLRPACAGHAAGDAAAFPQLPPRKKPRPQTLAAIKVTAPGGVLFFRRPETASLMPGLWELPTLEPDAGEDPAPRLAALVEARTGRRPRLGGAPWRVRHGILDRKITLHVYPADLEETPPAGADWDFVAPGEVTGRGVSSMYTKALAAPGSRRPA